MEEERNYCVYFHENKINGKLYFGITCRSPQRRWGKDGAGYKGSIYFYSAIQKYGWDNFYHIIVKRNLTAEEAGNMEKELIALYRTTEPEFGYNLESGGLLNVKVNDSTKQKLRNANLGKKHSEETKKKMSESQKGRAVSKETKKKISDAQKGKVIPEETKTRMSENQWMAKQVICIETGIIYRSYSEAARQVGVSAQGIWKCINGSRHTAAGYHWKKYQKEKE